MLYTQTHSFMHIFTPKRTHSSFCEINFLLSAYRSNFAQVVRTTWRVDRASYWPLSGSAFSACVHKVLKVQKSR